VTIRGRGVKTGSKEVDATVCVLLLREEARGDATAVVTGDGRGLSVKPWVGAWCWVLRRGRWPGVAQDVEEAGGSGCDLTSGVSGERSESAARRG
jgi:hypothetical protein